MVRAFTVPGEPRGKGRPRFSKRGIYTDAQTTAYEEKIKTYYKDTHGGYIAPDTAFLRVSIIAYLQIPKSATKAEKTAMEARKILPAKKPDADNIAKVVLDALNGVAYKDDASVHAESCVKFYSYDPRIEVYIEEV